MAVFALLESSKLIARKIWVIEKLWNFHTVRVLTRDIQQRHCSEGWLPAQPWSRPLTLCLHCTKFRQNFWFIFHFFPTSRFSVRTFKALFLRFVDVGLLTTTLPSERKDKDILVCRRYSTRRYSNAIRNYAQVWFYWGI